MIALQQQLLETLGPWRSAPAWRIALSGGLDSTVLLHLLVCLGRQQALPPLSAIHVHHGLQPAADAWPEHCRRLCAELGVPLQVEYVQVDCGASLERAAREARYAALARQLGEGELLLTGQHRDDQAETLLLRLLRGAGVRGLASMPAQRALGRGLLLRPLLQVPRAALEAYADEQGLAWVEDPSNSDSRLARNFLRREVLPGLAPHWPYAASNLARSAAHLREAQELLDELARQDLAGVDSGNQFAWFGLPSLALAPLLSLSDARQRNALRHWLAPLTALPDSEHWAGWRDLRDAAVDASPLWKLASGELRRADGRLWWLSGDWQAAAGEVPQWLDPTAALALPGNGQVQIVGSAPLGPLQLRYRQGGEVLAVPGRGHRDLKRLLNERGIPAFVRGRLPLLYRGDELLAVANLPELDGTQWGDWHLQWQPPTSDQRLS